MDKKLEDRIRTIIGSDKDVTETRMFGGLCFMLNGNMQICARRDGSVLARTGAANAEKGLKKPGVERMVMRGKEMADYLIVAADRLDDKSLRGWVEVTRAYVATLPKKEKKS